MSAPSMIVNFKAAAPYFDINNAWLMAHLSKLAYSDYDTVQTTLLTWGMKLVSWWDIADTQAFVAFIEDNVFLVFRGTQTDSLGDVMTDLKVSKVACASNPQSEVHSGFAEAIQSVWEGHASVPPIPVALQATFAAMKNPKLFITGHSLGAALATLAADRCSSMTPNTTLYTFGSPRVGNANFCKHLYARLNRRVYRIVNNNDLVTRVPMRNMGYDHTQGLWYLHEDGHITNDPTWWQQFLDRALGALCDVGTAGIDGLKDHSMDAGQDGYIPSLARTMSAKKSG